MACGLSVIANAARRAARGGRHRRQRGAARAAAQRAALADAIGTCLRDPAETERMGQAARARVERLFQWERGGRGARRRLRGGDPCCSRSISRGLTSGPAICSSTRAAARGATASGARRAARASSASTSISPRCGCRRRPAQAGPREGRGSARCCRATPSISPSPTRASIAMICSEVMEHVHDYRAAARELARVASRGEDRDHDPHRDQRAALPAPRRRLLREPGRPHPHLPPRDLAQGLAARASTTDRRRLRPRPPHALLDAAFGGRPAARRREPARARLSPFLIRSTVSPAMARVERCSTSSARRA